MEAAGSQGPGQAWYELDTCCVYCRKDDYSCSYGPRSLLLCSCCPKGTHVACYEKAKGIVLTQEFIDSGSCWFCSKACEEISVQFEHLVGKRVPIKGESAEYSLEVVKYDKGSKAARTVVEAAKNIFKSAFDPLVMENGQDLVTMCCHAYESPDVEDAEEEELVDYSAFRVVALRKGGQIVTVATLRLFGDQLAEMPFVSTRPGFRRAGHCRRLLKGVEALLRQLRVRWLVLPSIRSVLAVWRFSFSFMPLTLEEQAALEPHIVSPDYESAQLVKKAMWPPPKGSTTRPAVTSAAAVKSGSSRGCGATRSSDKAKASSSTTTRTRNRKPPAAAAVSVDSSDSDSDKDQNATVFKFKGRKTRAAAAAAAAAPAAGSSSDSDGQEEGDEEADAAKEEAAAAWALWEAAGGKMGSDDKDSDFDADSDSSSESDSDDADLDLEPEEDGPGRVRSTADRGKAKPAGAQQQHSAQGGKDGGNPAAGAGSSAADDDKDPELAAAEAKVLEALRKEVQKSGGQLPAGWAVRLGNKQPTGYYKEKSYVEPGTGKTFRTVPAVKRHLGLAAPVRAGPKRTGNPAELTDREGSAEPQVAGQNQTEAAVGGIGGSSNQHALVANNPEQQLAQLKLLRARAAAAKQQRLRVMRARKQLVTKVELAAVLAESIRRFYHTAATELAATGAEQGWLSPFGAAFYQQHMQQQLQLLQQAELVQQQQSPLPCAPHADCKQPQQQQQQQGASELAQLEQLLAARDAEVLHLKQQQQLQAAELAAAQAQLQQQRELVLLLQQQLEAAHASACAAAAAAAAGYEEVHEEVPLSPPLVMSDLSQPAAPEVGPGSHLPAADFSAAAAAAAAAAAPFAGGGTANTAHTIELAAEQQHCPSPIGPAAAAAAVSEHNNAKPLLGQMAADSTARLHHDRCCAGGTPPSPGGCAQAAAAPCSTPCARQPVSKYTPDAAVGVGARDAAAPGADTGAIPRARPAAAAATAAAAPELRASQQSTQDNSRAMAGSALGAAQRCPPAHGMPAAAAARTTPAFAPETAAPMPLAFSTQAATPAAAAARGAAAAAAGPAAAAAAFMTPAKPGRPPPAAVAAAAASSGVSGSSPRLSDSFLSGLLPYVVGQLLETPQSAATAKQHAVKAAQVPSTDQQPQQDLLQQQASGHQQRPDCVPLVASQPLVIPVLEPQGAHPVMPDSGSGRVSVPAAGATGAAAARAAVGASAATASAPDNSLPSPVTAGFKGCTAAAAAAASGGCAQPEASAVETGSCSPPSPTAHHTPQHTAAPAGPDAPCAPPGPSGPPGPPAGGGSSADRSGSLAVRLSPAAVGPRAVCCPSQHRPSSAAGAACVGRPADSCSSPAAGAVLSAGRPHAAGKVLQGSTQASADRQPVVKHATAVAAAAVSATAVASLPAAASAAEGAAAAVASYTVSRGHRERHEQPEAVAARPLKKRKLHSAVLDWFGEIADVAADDDVPNISSDSASMGDSAKDDSSSGQGSGGSSRAGALSGCYSDAEQHAACVVGGVLHGSTDGPGSVAAAVVRAAAATAAAGCSSMASMTGLSCGTSAPAAAAAAAAAAAVVAAAPARDCPQGQLDAAGQLQRASGVAAGQMRSSSASPAAAVAANSSAYVLQARTDRQIQQAAPAADGNAAAAAVMSCAAGKQTGITVRQGSLLGSCVRDGQASNMDSNSKVQTVLASDMMAAEAAAAAAAAAGDEGAAAEGDMEAEMCAAMDTAALFAFAGDL